MSKKNEKKLSSNKNCIFRGKKCITFDGKKILYDNKNDLIKKIMKYGMRERQAKEWVDKILKDQTKRIIIKDTGEFETFDIRENFKGMLKTNFNIIRVPNKKIIEGGPIKNTDIIEKLGKYDLIKSYVRINMFVNWPSPNPESIWDIIKRKDGRNITDREKQDIDKTLENMFPNENDYYKRLKYMNELAYELDKNKLKTKLYVDKTIENRKTDVKYNGNEKNLENFVWNVVEGFAANNRFGNGKILGHNYYLLTSYRKQKVERAKYYIGNKEYRLTQWINIEYLGPWKNEGDSCAVKYISLKYPELYWKIKKMETSKGVSIRDFDNFCNENQILYIFRTIDEKIFKTNKNNDCFKEVSEFQEQQALCAIVYDGHIYPYSGGKLKRIAKKPQQKIKSNNLGNSLISLLDGGIVPNRIKINIKKNPETKQEEISILSYIHKGIKYFENNEYKRCKEILKYFGIKENIPDNVNINSIFDFVLKTRKSKFNVSTFLPEKSNFKLKSILWQTDKDINTEDLNGIDKNKTFAHALANLSYLLRHDWRKHKVIDIEKENFLTYSVNEKYAYLVKAKYFTTFLPHSGLYPGYHILKARKIGIEFDLLEEYETDICYNFYSEIIDDFRKVLTNDEFKSMMVVLIGKMERDISENPELSFSSIEKSNNDDFYSGYTKQLGDYTIRINKKDKIKYVRDQLLINNQIKCYVFDEIYEEIKKMDLDNKQIVQINTDSIFFYGDIPKDLSKKDKEEMKNDFNGWKICGKFKNIDYAKSGYKNDKPIVKSLELENCNTEPRILYMKYAGNGKTHTIINDVIPMCIKNGKSYIVLTSMHGLLDEYRLLGLNCEILQKFCFDETIPNVDVIIIDEIGCCAAECHDFIYKLNYFGKSFICFGDFNQMLPPGEDKPYNQTHYLKYLFNEIREEFSNFRNGFTKEYYDMLINSKIDLNDEVNKYSTENILDAEYAICFRNKDVKNTNKKILKLLGLKPYGVGTKLICITNKLKESNIWNNKSVIVKKIYQENNKSYYELEDKIGKIITLPEKKVFSNFDHAYCINIYHAQGKTINSYYWVNDKNKDGKDKWLSGYKNSARIAYTVISRLTIGKKNSKFVAGLLRLDELENGKKDIVFTNNDDYGIKQK
jgi:hypothetical protein